MFLSKCYSDLTPFYIQFSFYRVFSKQCLFLIFLLLSGCSDNQFTGTYMADGRPQQISFLSIVDSNHQIAGTITTIEPTRQGDVESSTNSITGTADGNSISLAIEQFIGKTTLTGKKISGKIELNYPGKDGQISKVVFRSAAEEEFNIIVNQFKQNLATNYQAQMQLKQAIEEEQSKLVDLSQKLAYNVRAIQQTGIGDDVSRLVSSLSEQYKAYNTLEANLQHLKYDASMHPMTCYQAEQVVAYDFDQEMGYSYEQSLGYFISQFNEAAKSLKKRFETAKQLITETQAIAIQLKTAFDTHLYPLPNLPIRPGEEVHTLDKYQTLVDAAKIELEGRTKDSNNLVEKAKALMREGKSVKKQAQTSIKCKQ